MGVLKHVEPDPSVIKAWIMPGTGVMLCVDQRFADWLGKSGVDTIGHHFKSLAVDQGELERSVQTRTPLGRTLSRWAAFGTTPG